MENDDGEPWQQLDLNYVRAERLSDLIFVAVLSVVLLVIWLVLMLTVFSSLASLVG